jgi:hypothetical protein
MLWIVATALAGTKVQIGEMTVNGLVVRELFCDWGDTKGAIMAGPAVVGALAAQKEALDACAPQGSAAKLQWSSATPSPLNLESETPEIGACLAAAAVPVVKVTKGSCTAVVLVGEPKRAAQIAASVK